MEGGTGGIEDRGAGGGGRGWRVEGWKVQGMEGGGRGLKVEYSHCELL